MYLAESSLPSRGVICLDSFPTIFHVKGSLSYKTLESDGIAIMSNTYSRHGSVSLYNLEDNNVPSEVALYLPEQPRRCTTITLREIRYPEGCPCHPKDSEKAKKQAEKLKRLEFLDNATPAYVPHARPEMTIRSDSLNSTSSSSSPTRASLSRFFRRSSSRS